MKDYSCVISQLVILRASRTYPSCQWSLTVRVPDEWVIWATTPVAQQSERPSPSPLAFNLLSKLHAILTNEIKSLRLLPDKWSIRRHKQNKMAKWNQKQTPINNYIMYSVIRRLFNVKGLLTLVARGHWPSTCSQDESDPSCPSCSPHRPGISGRYQGYLHNPHTDPPPDCGTPGVGLLFLARTCQTSPWV